MRDCHRLLLTTLLVTLAILLVLARAAMWIHHGPRVHSSQRHPTSSNFE
jgi:hypothetical protein